MHSVRRHIGTIINILEVIPPNTSKVTILVSNPTGTQGL